MYVREEWCTDLRFGEIHVVALIMGAYEGIVSTGNCRLVGVIVFSRCGHNA